MNVMERMSGAEFAARRVGLGLTLAEMGERLGVRADTVKRWEAEKEPIPYRVPAEVAELVGQQRALAKRMVDADVVVEVSRRDGWALGAAARALEVEPDLMIEWHGGA